MEIMEKCCEAIEAIAQFAAKGSRLAVFRRRLRRRLLQGGPPERQPQRVHQHQEHAGPERGRGLNAKANAMLDKYCPMADEIFAQVRANF